MRPEKITGEPVAATRDTGEDAVARWKSLSADEILCELSAIVAGHHVTNATPPDTLIIPRSKFIGIRSGMWPVSKWEKRQRARRRRRFAHKRRAR